MQTGRGCNSFHTFLSLTMVAVTYLSATAHVENTQNASVEHNYSWTAHINKCLVRNFTAYLYLAVGFLVDSCLIKSY